MLSKNQAEVVINGETYVLQVGLLRKTHVQAVKEGSEVTTGDVMQEMVDREGWVTGGVIEAAELILTEQECYQATIAYAHRLGRKVQRGTHAGDKALCEAQIQKLLDAGYTRPEPTENQVEAVANLLCGDCNHQANHRCQPQGTDAMDCYGDLARSILKLCQPEQLDRPKIVCLCGSGRFRQAFEDAEYRETLAGKIVLTIGCNTHDVARSAELVHHKPMLDELHLRKIDLADEVFVLNVGGYIGEGTRSEIDYARKLGKPIRWLETPC